MISRVSYHGSSFSQLHLPITLTILPRRPVYKLLVSRSRAHHSQQSDRGRPACRHSRARPWPAQGPSRTPSSLSVLRFPGPLLEFVVIENEGNSARGVSPIPVATLSLLSELLNDILSHFMLVCHEARRGYSTSFLNFDLQV